MFRVSYKLIPYAYYVKLALNVNLAYKRGVAWPQIRTTIMARSLDTENNMIKKGEG